MFLVMDVELSWCFMSSWTGKELRKSLNGSVPSVESLSVPDSVVELVRSALRTARISGELRWWIIQA